MFFVVSLVLCLLLSSPALLRCLRCLRCLLLLGFGGVFQASTRLKFRFCSAKAMRGKEEEEEEEEYTAISQHTFEVSFLQRKGNARQRRRRRRRRIHRNNAAIVDTVPAMDQERIRTSARENAGANAGCNDGVEFGATLWRAAQKGQTHLVKAMVVGAMELNIHFALFVAVANDHVEVVHLLTRKHVRARVSNLFLSHSKLGPLSFHKSLALLSLAARMGYAETAAAMLQHKAPVNWKDCRGRTALHLAARGGHGSTARVLLQAKANIDATGIHGATPWHMAMRCTRTKTAGAAVIALLVQSKADVANAYGTLDDCRTRAALKATLAAKVCVDEPDLTHGATPLMWAAKYVRADVVERLLEAKASAQQMSTREGGVLHWAASSGDSIAMRGSCVETYGRALDRTVQLLLNAKASIAAQDSQGRTPAEVAKMNADDSYNYIMHTEGYAHSVALLSVLRKMRWY